MAKARAYTLGKIPEDQKFRGQGELIMNALSAETPKTVEQLATGISEKLQTRQSPERVVSFYMSVWKKKGWVRTTDVEVADAPDSVEAGEANVDPADAASTGASEEVRGEADVEAQVGALEQKTKMSDAVVHALGKAGDESLRPEEIVQYLNGHGYKCSQQQVAGALQNLMRRGAVARDGEAFSLAKVHA